MIIYYELTMNVQVEPRSIFMRVGWSVEEDHLTLVPSLIGLTNICEIERSEPVGWVRTDSRHSAFITLSTVGGITVVPYVYGYSHSLIKI